MYTEGPRLLALSEKFIDEDYGIHPKTPPQFTYRIPTVAVNLAVAQCDPGSLDWAQHPSTPVEWRGQSAVMDKLTSGSFCAIASLFIEEPQWLKGD